MCRYICRLTIGLFLVLLFSLGMCGEGIAGLGFDNPVPLSSKAATDGTAWDDCTDIAFDSSSRTWVTAWRAQNPTNPNETNIYISVSYDPFGGSGSFYRIGGDTKVGCPSIATDSKGNWIIVFTQSWNSNDTSDSRTVYSLRANSSNYYNWQGSIVSQGTSTTIQRDPKVASDENGNWIVTWASNYRYTSSTDTNTDYDIFASFSTNNGQTWSSPSPVKSPDDGFATADIMPSVTWTGRVANDWLIAWRYGNFEGAGGILWSRYRGTWQSPEGVPGTDASSMDPTIVTDRKVLRGLCIIGGGCSDTEGTIAISWRDDLSSDKIFTANRVCTQYSSKFPQFCIGYAWNTPYQHSVKVPTGDYPGPTIEAVGSLFVLLYPNNYGKVGVRYSTDSGTTWTPGVFPSEPYYSGTSMATDGLGRWIAVWPSLTDWGGQTGQDTDIFYARVLPPGVSTNSEHSPTDENPISFEVHFSEDVTGVDISDFLLPTTGSINDAKITEVIPSLYNKYQYRVVVDRGTGMGTIRLDVKDDDTIQDLIGNPLGGIGAGNGNYTSGGITTISAPPQVLSISRLNPLNEATLSSTVTFRVNFSEAVTGVDTTDFSLSGTLTSKSITGVSPSTGTVIDVTVNTGTTESGTVRLDVIDNNTIRAGDDNHPLGGWGFTNYTSGQSYIIDRTPPDSSEARVSPVPASVTADDTKLKFTWSGFKEDTIPGYQGIVSYEVALGTPGIPEGIQTYKNVGNVNQVIFCADMNSSDCATPPQGVYVVDLSTKYPGKKFPQGDYVCSVKAKNAVGLLSTPVSGTVKIDTTALKFGGDILAFEGKTWNDIDWNNTKLPLPPSKHAIKIDNLGKLVAGDLGSFQITWYLNNGTNYIRVYNTISDTAQDPMILYHTHIKDINGKMVGTDIDCVNLGPVSKTVIHYNTAVTQLNGPGAEQIWMEGTLGKNLCATEGTVSNNDRHLIILEYQDNTSATTGYEIVEIKDYSQPDIATPDGAAYIGSRLFSYKEIPEGKEVEPKVRRGQQEGLIYQHMVEGSLQRGHLWAIKKNDEPYDMEVIWKRKGLNNIVWYWEIRRYTAKWPADDSSKYQKYVRDAKGQLAKVEIPAALHPEEVSEDFLDPLDHDWLINGTQYYTDGAPGWSLLKYQTGTVVGQDWVGFEVVRSLLRADPLVMNNGGQKNIGTEITDASHEGPKPGYIYNPAGNRYAPEVYADTGQIFAVNKGQLEVWWSNLSSTFDPKRPKQRVQWPSKVVQYNAVWPMANVLCAVDNEPTVACKMIIARQNGSDVIDSKYGADWIIYGADGSKEDPTKPGFNPNEEHALKAGYSTGTAVFALRDDLGTQATSEPYVLMQYKEPPDNKKWRFRVFKVIREDAPYYFHEWAGVSRPNDPYEGVAGLLIQAPFPLGTLKDSIKADVVSGPAFEDRKGQHWVKAAGDDGKPATITMRYYYPVQTGFYFPNSTHNVGEDVPWLDNGTGTPVNVTYTVSWPDSVPKLKIGQTLIEGMNGLPTIKGQCSVDIVYQQSLATGGGPSVKLIDPVQVRQVNLASLPPDIAFSDLSLALRLRVSYDPDPINPKLKFKGMIVDPPTGFDYALLNVMSQRDHDELLALSGNTSWKTAVNALYQKAKDPVEIQDSSVDPYDALALTAGFAEGVGYVTLAMQNSAKKCDESLPVSLKVIQVVAELEAGEIAVITPDCPFDETLTLRHKGDFAGLTDDYQFQWRYMPDASGVAPPGPYGSWTSFGSGKGAVDITIKGPGLLTLSDNWFVCRYRYMGAENIPLKGIWSNWTPPKLAEGWIKRVVGDINPFQRAIGGGIEGAENDFFDYKKTKVNTIVSMISQAGPPWTGDIPMNCTSLDEFGLIQIYETVLGRGIDLSIDGLPPVDYPPANNALLLVASRIADLYTLLGNEAYADASDPTIAFGTDDAQYGAEATSIHSFMNMTSSLLEEELALLRGRDDSQDPPTQEHPFYNRLKWNFTNNEGEMAYAMNYDITDKNGNVDGKITEADAKMLYPQGHGDAWGHYLTAIKSYYKLLTHPNYTWKARAEDVDGTTVDYLDERKFATVAAAKAQTGAEIVNLTYRDAYVEDPSGQWQGYKDIDPKRAWGLSEWAIRAGQGAYFDWVTGNAILPSEDPDHTGIQKIDRTTVPELREVASLFQDIQAQVDTADAGLNPLGLATNVVPFDISPSEIDAGKTHFEQIYDRAVTAMNNAITVFNHANNSTQLLRRQADTLADFRTKVEDQTIDFKNRLIEIFGYPYRDDKAYPENYDGPDLINYDLVDPSELLGVDPPPVIEFPVTITDFEVLDDGSLKETTKDVVFHISTTGFGCVKPKEWTGQRRAPGEIQMSRSELLQARARFEKALYEYDNLLADIEDQAALLEAQYKLNAEEINVLNEQLNQQKSLNSQIMQSRSNQVEFRKQASMITIISNAYAEFLPTCAGMATDVTSAARGAIRLAGSVIAQDMTNEADRESLAELDHQQALQDMQSLTNITLTSSRQELAIQQQIKQLEQAVRREILQRVDLYTMQEAMQQASGRYLQVLAKGERLLEDRIRFFKQTATDIQSRRYKDMAFRIFRNDALQKYRAQFDLAARYVYLAAKAYDFETTFLSSDRMAGEAFLTDIVRARLIGTISGNTPQTGQGLADSMARMSYNFCGNSWSSCTGGLKGQLGFNNPEKETNRFTLRSELFRIQPGSAGDTLWSETLWRYVVPNLLDLPEFKKYCVIPSGLGAVEPAIVIPFSTNINARLNFFGWPAMNDSTFSSTHYATKVRSVGVWFSNYDGLNLGKTPHVYLIPVGSDILRSPTTINGIASATREFKILDQALPTPFRIYESDTKLTDPSLGWIPIMDPDLGEHFADIRRHQDFRAYHDSGEENLYPETERVNSRLIGRSVWNTRWLLIIPAWEIWGDNPKEGLNRFIDGMPLSQGGPRDGNGVKDIKIFFYTYAY